MKEETSRVKFIPFRFMKEAHQLCLWERELAQARRAFGEKEIIPWCIQ
jgi:hypothetical protein